MNNNFILLFSSHLDAVQFSEEDESTGATKFGQKKVNVQRKNRKKPTFKSGKHDNGVVCNLNLIFEVFNFYSKRLSCIYLFFSSHLDSIQSNEEKEESIDNIDSKGSKSSMNISQKKTAIKDGE